MSAFGGKADNVPARREVCSASRPLPTRNAHLVPSAQLVTIKRDPPDHESHGIPARALGLDQKPPSICRSHLSLHRNVQAGAQQICGVRKFRQNIDHLCLAIELIASTYDPAYVREFIAVREYERDITLLIGLLGGFQEFEALDINVERNLIHYADRVQLSDPRHAAPLASFFRYEGALIDKRTADYAANGCVELHIFQSRFRQLHRKPCFHDVSCGDVS